MSELLNAAPLKLGDVAPDFWLTTPQGSSITRHDFRNKAGLIIVLLKSSDEGWNYIRALARDEAEYRELKAQILAIVRGESNSMGQPQLSDLVVLAVDPTDKAWTAYTGIPTGNHADAVAVFVLDLYGGLEAQSVASSVQELPDPAKVLEWVRGAQYRCNI